MEALALLQWYLKTVSNTTLEKLKVLKFALHFSRKLNWSKQLEGVLVSSPV